MFDQLMILESGSTSANIPVLSAGSTKSGIHRWVSAKEALATSDKRSRFLFVFIAFVMAFVGSAGSALASRSKHSPAGIGAKKVYFSKDRGSALGRLSADTHWTCRLSLFFSIERNEQAALAPEAEGRGLVSCKNIEGFQTDYPLLAEMKIQRTPELHAMLADSAENEFTISMNSSPFSITREMTDIQDKYDPKLINSSSKNELLILGEHNQVAINLTITSRNRPLRELVVKSLHLHFDNEAPEIY